jgi:hypothetical protein
VQYEENKNTKAQNILLIFGKGSLKTNTQLTPLQAVQLPKVPPSGHAFTGKPLFAELSSRGSRKKGHVAGESETVGTHGARKGINQLVCQTA